jgi:hypothetical protein
LTSDKRRSSSMAWEIRKAIELKRKLVAAKAFSTNNSPTARQRIGALRSALFNFNSIKSTLNWRAFDRTTMLIEANSA